MSRDTTDETPAVDPGRSFNVDAMRPEDASGVRDLFIAVYGKDYPIRVYLEPETLIGENAAGNILSTVARAPDGRIVGHCAIFRNAPFSGVFESGAGLVSKDFRGGRGVFSRMGDHCEQRGRDTPGVALLFGEPVCNHVFSQKATRGQGWRTTAMEVDLMPASAYAAEKSAPGRVSVLLDVVTIRPRPHRVYVPDIYRSAIADIYTRLDDERTIDIADAPLPAQGETHIRPRIFKFAQVARLTVDAVAQDFSDTLRRQEKTLRADGVGVIQLWLNLGWPWVDAAVAVARGQGYFFGGVLPRWYDSDGLLMQKTVARPHWEDMQVFFEDAQRLRDSVRQDWEAVTRGRS